MLPRTPWLLGPTVLALVITGCTAPSAPNNGTPTASVGAPAAQQRSTVKAAPDTRTGAQLDKPYVVDGIVVVSKDHRLSEKYVPDSTGQPNGLRPEVTAAFKELAAAAKKDGLTMTIRSGYRSFATQRDSFQQALRTNDEATARLYYAEAGASEHQTGLALDAWDGRNRGKAFTATPHAKWLAEHAHEFGFIIRYPEGKTPITGYAAESWHLRWVGKEVSQHFTPGSNLTLEEYLGLT